MQAKKVHLENFNKKPISLIIKDNKSPPGKSCAAASLQNQYNCTSFEKSKGSSMSPEDRSHLVSCESASDNAESDEVTCVSRT